MPRPNPPPTPGSSSDIRGKEGAHAAPTFNLPPTAFQETDRTSTSSATSSANGSDSSYRPASPTSPADLSKKRPATQQGPIVTKADFALPPPPTRSRKIIQMKPGESESTDLITMGAPLSPQAGRTQNTNQTSGKRKQNGSGNTAAGRKIARKTAHSLIERRRRSKMNEEFGVLKDMIPACKGQEMHKLAILQASVDYLRYLEQCVAHLQAQNNFPRPQPPPAARRQEQQEDENDEDEEMDDDEEAEAMASATTSQDRSASMVSLPSLSHLTSTTTTSPSVFSNGTERHYSISSASQSGFSPYFHSNTTSPVFGPQLSHISSMPASAGPHRDAFGLGSPALKPVDSAQQLRQIAEGASELSEKRRSHSSRTALSEHELDQEATAALLMLNNDRRNWRSSPGESVRRNAGMSVRDLLSG